MKPIRILSGDEEYVELRDQRNADRDNTSDLGIRGSYAAAKAIDPILELYERTKGIDHCQSIYLRHSTYKQ